MMIRKAISLLLTLIFISLLTSCGSPQKAENDTPYTTDNISGTESDEYNDEYTQPEHITDNAVITETHHTDITDNVTEKPELSDEPAEWSKTEIAEYYKNAADKSNETAKSEQIITLKDFSINNGQYENVIDFIMPLISKFLANNSTEKDGITGGYNKLSESDIQSAKAYKIGNNTAIEMELRNQKDGPKGNMLEGSVGHAISVIGDITDVTRQLSEYGLPEIQISENDTKIYYTNATVKVIISPEGKIVNGTWKYTVNINMNNYKVGNSTVENTTRIMDNEIKVGGGFAK